MKSAVIAAVTLCWGAVSLAPVSAAQASPDRRGHVCVARVLHSERLPYAPIGYWLARVTLQVTPPNGPPFITTWQENIPSQQASPRRGQRFGWPCDQ